MAAILYKLKTGCQWRFLPVGQLLPQRPLSWQGVFYYFNEWRKQGAWQQLWLSVLRQHRRQLNLSSIQLDGSHTPAKKGGAAVGYQGRKAARTTNALFLADSTGQPLAMSTPRAGNHHDTFGLGRVFADLRDLLTPAGLSLDGVFLNADKAFDTNELRQACADAGIETNIARNRRAADWQIDDATPLDPELYRRRLVIEQMNAWLDGFKAWLVRYRTCLEN